MLLLLLVVLGTLLYRTYLPGRIPFSNDGPLGRLMAECHRLPARFTGCWEDLNLLGDRDWGAVPSISFGLQYLLGPLLFAKFYALLALVILGLAAWCFFRQSGLAPPACLLGGLAAALCSGCFSSACWGVAAHPITVGMIYLALAALADTSLPRRWLRVALGGLAVGMAVTEGADVGALLSTAVGGFIIYQALAAEGPRAGKLAAGVARLALVVVFALLLAAQAIFSLVSTEINGVAGTPQETKTKQERWDWATQWSMPKVETLTLVVPGLFGFRADTPGGGEYWGAVGRAPAWDRYFASGREGNAPKGFLRYSGGGSYVGVLVALVAVWAAVQALRREDSVFSLPQRKLLWFWMAAAGVALLLSYGRFAPFYRVLYALPYFSTIRNPVKFLDIFAIGIVVLFGHGIDGLWRCFMQPKGIRADSRWAGLGAWWARASRFDKRWVKGCLLAVGLSLLGWFIYAASHTALERYLLSVQFDEARAQAIANFSSRQAGWFVVLLALATGALILILSGAWVGTRAKWGVWMLGLLLVADLVLANQPWIYFWDLNQKYATNAVVDRLKEKPYEHRVALMRFATPPELQTIDRLYDNQWLRHQFPYFNIQALDLVQMPRVPADVQAFQRALSVTNGGTTLPLVLRGWELTNTRYLIGPEGFSGAINKRFGFVNPPFRILERFNIVPAPGFAQVNRVDEVTVVPDDQGVFALVEFTRALPRAKLYSNWEINTNDAAMLAELTSPTFDPEKTVLVAGGVPPGSSATNAGPGTVEFASYAPKHLVLKCDASATSVLLLNDRFDPYWKVRVDGKPQPLLRCNYLMRGVYLTAGTHTVEFRFQPPIGPLYVSLAAIGVGIVILCMLFVTGRGNPIPVPAPAMAPQPAEPPVRGKSGARRASDGRRRAGPSGVRHSNRVME